MNKKRPRTKKYRALKQISKKFQEFPFGLEFMLKEMTSNDEDGIEKFWLAIKENDHKLLAELLKQNDELINATFPNSTSDASDSCCFVSE